MHPYYAHPWRSFRHRGGSRLLWFVIGAASASLWIKSHHAHEWHDRQCWRACISQKAYPAPGTQQPAAPQATESVNDGAGPNMRVAPQRDDRRGGWGPWNSERSRGWNHDGRFKQWPPSQSPRAAQEAQQAQQPAPAPPPLLPPTPMPGDRWEEDRQRVQALGKQATDTISDLSEATLDSVLATVQSLKTKLAENRVQREEHLQQMQALKDDQHKMFEEWKKQQEQMQREQPSEPRHLV